MKIAVICSNDLSKTGGIQKLSVAMHTKMLERGHESVLVSFHPQHKVDIPHTKFFGQGKYVFVNQTSTEVSTLDLKEIEKLTKYFEDEHFDYICIHHPYAPLLGLTVSNLKTKSIKVGWFHATLTHDYYRVLATPLTFALSGWLREKLDGFIAVSQSAYKTWKDTLNGNSIVMPVGVYLDQYQQAPKLDLGKDLNILFVGRLDQRKGVLDAIQVLALVRKHQPAKLWIIGAGPDHQKAQALAEELGVSKDIVFLGKVSEQKLPSYYKSADVYISPSHGGESLGIVLLEAMAAGTPVVAYANEGYRCVLGKSPWKHSLVPTENVSMLAKAVLEITQDQELHRKLVTWQNQQVKEYDWDYLIDQFVDYLLTLHKHPSKTKTQESLPEQMSTLFPY